ncbi:hypothetical protein JB92DRAFT_2950273 [Gautieria morchelliformis]|nr:hypothetical protein JB92DRAFT_2950273 [Gautieria morchelliformis]
MTQLILRLLVVDMVAPVEVTLTEHEDVEVEISVGVSEVGVLVLMTSTDQETQDGVGVGEGEVISRVKVPLGHGEVYYRASIDSTCCIIIVSNTEVRRAS